MGIAAVKNGSIVTPKGFRVAGLHSGVKRKRKDLGVLYCDVPASAAAVYTLNTVKAAPIYVTKESIAKEDKIQAIIVNSGNANACSGKQGMQDAYTMRDLTAEKFAIPQHYVAVASTGIIGKPMPMDKIAPHIKELSIGRTAEHAASFSEAILTTDTFTKTACYTATIDGKQITLAGTAKGSGMIAPNMATMLTFLTTDANIEADMLQIALKTVVDRTFNCITVDGDTSTNDTVMLLASSKVAHEALNPAHPEWQTFIALLTTVCEKLAKDIARDGEGATKLIEVRVNGAVSTEEAVLVAKSVVGSTLVKIACNGADANWGRVIAAIGYSGAKVDPQTIDIAFGPEQVLKQSEPVASLAAAQQYLENEHIIIEIDLNLGEKRGKAWGCDLTYDYVRRSASYRL